jgi:7SK snRNA methylphosphate capping enzyme
MKRYSNGTTTYYRYRKDDDNRLKLMNASWLTGKKVLDIGCNTGHVTLEVARQFKPFLMEGIDIDGQLIKDAQKKQRALIREKGQDEKPAPHIINKKTQSFAFVPRAVAQKAAVVKVGQKSYPSNALFQAVDILAASSTSASALSQTTYDTILCLSVTKWVQLNTGDEGLRTLFRRSFDLLSPGGVFLLEYQPWQSYIKNRNTSAVTKENFLKLKILPEEFESLLVEEGFVVSGRLGTPLAEAKGFKRPVLVLTKPRDDDDVVEGSAGASAGAAVVREVSEEQVGVGAVCAEEVKECLEEERDGEGRGAKSLERERKRKRKRDTTSHSGDDMESEGCEPDSRSTVCAIAGEGKKTKEVKKDKKVKKEKKEKKEKKKKMKVE